MRQSARFRLVWRANSGSLADLIAALIVAGGVSLGCFGTLARAAEVSVSPKHLLILRSGLDAVYGTYVFAVQNGNSEKQEFSSTILMPKETDDFMPEEGLKAENVELINGDLKVRRILDPGLQILSVGFRVPAHDGFAPLTLVPPYDLPSLTILVPRKSTIRLKNSAFRSGAGNDDPQYMTWEATSPLSAGKPFVLEVEGVAEGRRRLWGLGAITFAILVTSAIAMAVRTRPESKAIRA